MINEIFYFLGKVKENCDVYYPKEKNFLKKKNKDIVFHILSEKLDQTYNKIANLAKIWEKE